jgi:hypothetical protein
MRNPGQGVEKGKRDCVMMANLKFCQNTWSQSPCDVQASCASLDAVAQAKGWGSETAVNNSSIILFKRVSERGKADNKSMKVL